MEITVAHLTLWFKRQRDSSKPSYAQTISKVVVTVAFNCPLEN